MKKSPTKEELKNRDDVQASIKQRAYLIAESEGFPHGRDLIHWLQAEEEILARHMRELSDMVKNAVVSATSRGKAGDGKATKIPVQSETKSHTSKPTDGKAKATTSKPASKASSAKPKAAGSKASSAKPKAAAKSSSSKPAPQSKKSPS